MKNFEILLLFDNHYMYLCHTHVFLSLSSEDMVQVDYIHFPWCILFYLFLPKNHFPGTPNILTPPKNLILKTKERLGVDKRVAVCYN